MRGLSCALALCLVVPASAQIPDRKELTATPRFVTDAPKPAFKAFSEAQLKAALKVISARSYAVFGYNTPEVRLVLPKVANSSYASVEFGTATLLDTKGKAVDFELEEGGFNEERSTAEIRFRMKEGDGVLDYARARGVVKVKFPLAVRTTVVAKGKAAPAELSVKIDGPYVSFNDEAARLPDTSFTHLKPLRAYDAAGKQLEQHGYSEASTDDDGVYRRRTSFYGNVARVELDTVDGWAELELPYDLKPAPLLPKGDEGLDPERAR